MQFPVCAYMHVYEVMVMVRAITTVPFMIVVRRINSSMQFSVCAYMHVYEVMVMVLTITTVLFMIVVRTCLK